MITNDVLLIFFALPIAVIIISIALQKIFRNPILVAAIIFAIFLIVTFVIDNIQFLVAAIAYAIISYITAFLTYIICRFLKEQRNNSNCCTNDSNNGINTISNNNSQNCNCGCNNNDDNNEVLGVNGVSARIDVIPNNNGTTGSITGCYRRREF